MDKTPITDFKKGNCCPRCNSTKVSLRIQFPAVKEFDMKGKEIIKVGGKRVVRPSNRILAAYYSCIENQEMQCAQYKCNKCGWKSEVYTP